MAGPASSPIAAARSQSPITARTGTAEDSTSKQPLPTPVPVSPTGAARKKPKRSSLTSSFKNARVYAPPRTLKTWTFPKATPIQPIHPTVLAQPQDPTLNKYAVAQAEYRSSFMCTARGQPSKHFLPYNVPPPSVGTYDYTSHYELTKVLEGADHASVSVPFRARASHKAQTPHHQLVNLYPTRTRHASNLADVNDWEEDLYKRRGCDVESYRVRLSGNLSQLDVTAKAQENDNYMTLPFRSESAPNLHRVPDTKTLTPGEFFDSTPPTVQVSDPKRESWVFRRSEEPGRRKLNVGDAVRKYIQAKKRELENEKRPKTARVKRERQGC